MDSISRSPIPLSPTSTTTSDDESEYAYDRNVISMLSEMKDAVRYPSVNSTPRQAPPRPSTSLQPRSTEAEKKYHSRKIVTVERHGRPGTMVTPALSHNTTHRERALQSRVQHLERLLKETLDKERVSRARQEGAINSAREAARQREAQKVDLETTKAMMSSIGVEKAGLVSRINNLQNFLVAEKKARQEAESEAASLRLQNSMLSSQLEASHRGIEDLRALLVEAGSLHADKHSSTMEMHERCLKLQDRVAKYKDDLAASLHELQAVKIENGNLMSQVQGLHIIVEEMTNRRVLEATEELNDSEERQANKQPYSKTSAPASASPIRICRIKSRVNHLAFKKDERDDLDELDDQMVAQMRELILQRKRRVPSRAFARNKTSTVLSRESESEEEDARSNSKEEEAQSVTNDKVPRIPPAIRFLASCPLSLSPSKSPMKGPTVVVRKQRNQRGLSQPPIEVGPVEQEENKSVVSWLDQDQPVFLELDAHDPAKIPSSSRAEALRHQLRMDLASDDEL